MNDDHENRGHGDHDRPQDHRPYHITVDHKPHDWPERFINGAQIKKLAGVDAATYDAWQDVPGPEDELIADDKKVDLSKRGTERFFTGKKTTTEGLTQSFLPPADLEYVKSKGIAFEEVQDGAQRGLILKNWLLPAGKFDVDRADILILPPAGYPDAPPDMFYLLPWVKLAGAGRYPTAADQPVNFAGKIWQRWSRHSNEWRSGVDGIWTMIKRIENALREAK